MVGGVGVANQLIFVFNLAIFGAVSGAGIFGAQFYGNGDHEGVRSAFRFKLLIGGVLVLLGLGIFLLFGENLISLYLKGEDTAVQRADTLRYAIVVHDMTFAGCSNARAIGVGRNQK